MVSSLLHGITQMVVGLEGFLQKGIVEVEDMLTIRDIFANADLNQLGGNHGPDLIFGVFRGHKDRIVAMKVCRILHFQFFDSLLEFFLLLLDFDAVRIEPFPGTGRTTIRIVGKSKNTRTLTAINSSVCLDLLQITVDYDLILSHGVVTDSSKMDSSKMEKSKMDSRAVADYNSYLFYHLV